MRLIQFSRYLLLVSIAAWVALLIFGALGSDLAVALSFFAGIAIGLAAALCLATQVVETIKRTRGAR